MQVADLVRNAARRFPGRDAVREGSRVRTFAELDRQADALAAALLARGLQSGDRVALLAQNELEYVEIQVAAQRAGVVLVPLNFRLAVPELEFIVADSGARVLLHGPGYEGAAGKLAVDTVIHLGPDGVGERYDDVVAAHAGARLDAPLDAERPACILYTSGTTGRPKGAVLSNLALYARCAAMAIDFRTRPGSVFVQTLPMFHISANTAYSFTYTGSTIVLVKDFSVAGVVETLHRSAATHVLMVPGTINLFVNEPGIEREQFEHLRLVIYGASSIAPDVLRRAIAVFGCDFLQLFGMTETSACSILRQEDHDPVGRPDLLSSAGTDAVSFETKVVDPTGQECEPGVVGEIVARGPALMSAYWANPAATAEAMRDGWMHTGDLGHRSAEGYLFVTDRLKDMIVTGGENVYPREVEDVLFAHPAVLEAGVIGVPDARWGERVHAVVVLRPDGSASAEELIAHCRDELAGYKCPKTVEFIAALPKNATGKVLKRELRARAS
ncbi:MAG TPA: long-chain-fatty-acid--CoA ligase [Acidimicrobiales bacterium]